MSSTAFPINDLVRRRFQTGLALATLTLSVASTLFLLLFSSRLGFGISTATNTFTLGLNATFSQFFIFIGVLIFLVGAVLTSFVTFLMISQRMRDIGLIKAAGCPNDLIAGYFTTELLILTVSGCGLGVLFGLTLDFATAYFLFPTTQSPNFWFAPIVFTIFFVLSLGFGIRPMLKIVRMSPSQALSPVTYYSLEAEKRHKSLSKKGLTWKLAVRSLSRRYSASIRIIILLSIVFLLLTVSIAGAVIAGDTTKSWIEKASNPDLLLVAHDNMADQYKLLLSKFSGSQENTSFNYLDSNFAISNDTIKSLYNISGISNIQPELILKEHAKEVSSYLIGEPPPKVGGSRESDIIVIGVEPADVSEKGYIQGRFLNTNDTMSAVIGDSLSKTIYAVDKSKGINLSDPLIESLSFLNVEFKNVGVVIDPLNNGYVAYVPLSSLTNITGLLPNILLLKLDSSVDRASTIAQIRSLIQGINPDLDVYELVDTVNSNINFLSSTWSTILIVPLLSLALATLCLASYMMLGIEEQRQEFAVLRAVGAKPRLITNIVAIQSCIVMFSSLGVGLSFGIISTFCILMKQPLITSFTIIEIAVWFILALGIMFLCSIYPALKLAKSPILKIII